MSVDPNTLKEGDLVHVRGRIVEKRGPGNPIFQVVFLANQTALLWPEEIVHGEPRPLKTNDTCIDKVTGWRGTIAAVDGSEAWVRWGFEAPNASAMRPKSPIMPLHHLERAEG